MDWHNEALRLYGIYGKQWTRIADNIAGIKQCFPDRTRAQTAEAIRIYVSRHKGENENYPKEESCFPVGVFGDVHIPFDHPNYLLFVKDTFTKYGVREVVCTGDLVDNHAISRHEKEPCARGAYDELDAAIDRVAEYVDAFPSAKMCKGNHDGRPEKQAATVGIGSRYLKGFSELLHLPDTWVIKNAFVINDVLYKHGMNCSGKDGAYNAAVYERMSTVIGHTHAFAGCKYSANHRNIIFGLNVGCGIDIDAYAFEYGKHAAHRPILGCGIVFSPTYAIFVPMGNNYFRHDGR